MNVFVARQPIFHRNKKIYGYELLFRDGISDSFPDIDGQTATSRLLSNSFLSIGLNQLTQGKKAFINFPQQLIYKKIPTLFQFENLMLEILEDVDPTEEFINICKDLTGAGYDIVLDDFVFKKELQPLIDLATIIKIDFVFSPIDEIEYMISRLNTAKTKLLAEKIETYEEFEKALDMGFTYFQGFFFSKPEIISGKEISNSSISLLQIINETNREDCQIDKLENIINRDVSISYKLLRYINSAYFRRAQEIKSIRQAIILLGKQELKKFIFLIATAKLASGKPNELIRASMIRAKICEYLGSEIRPESDTSELFLMGLFSFIDAILDKKMEVIMGKLPLSKNIKAALVDGRGELADYLRLISHYEKGNWNDFDRISQDLGIAEEKMSNYYLEAVQWSDQCAVL